MKFIKITEDCYMIVDSNNKIITKKEMLELTRKGLLEEELTSNGCVKKTMKKRKKIEKELNEVIEETAATD